MMRAFCITESRRLNCSGPVGNAIVVEPFFTVKLPFESKTGTKTSGSTSSFDTTSDKVSALNSPFSSSCSFFSKNSLDGVTLSSNLPCTSMNALRKLM